MFNTIIQGDSLKILQTLPSESVDCAVTSPPYWALRDYGVEGQLGLEPTVEEYITKLCNIFDEMHRILKNTGTCWVNLGDTYSNKCLCQIPSRFSIEMANRGWILRNDIVWYKRNSMPSSVKGRLANKWEHVFFFVKSQKYYFNLDAIRKPHLLSSINRINAGFSDKGSFNYRVREACKGTLEPNFGSRYHASEEEKNKYASLSLEEAEKSGSRRARLVRYNSKKKELRDAGVPHDLANCHPLGGNPGDVIQIDEPSDFWDITTQAHPFAHFAVYPERLIEPAIKAGCPEGGIVLDPFAGSGTTCLVALKQNKKFLGIELNAKYIEIANERLKPYLEQNKLCNIQT